MESTATLYQRARCYWTTWAPPVLAAGGDWAKEQAALQRPGVAAARAEYDEVVVQIQAREARSGVRAFNDVYVASACIEAALARGSDR